MNSWILRIASRHLMPVLLIFSIIILFRGHNNPGGGFIGGLVAASAFVLYAFANSINDTHRVLPVDPHLLIGFGLLSALASGIPALYLQTPFMTGQWTSVNLPLLGELLLGTPLLFDIGVYLVVIGVTLTIIFALEED